MSYLVHVYADRRFPPFRSFPVESGIFPDYDLARDWFNSNFCGFGDYTAEVLKIDESSDDGQPSEEWHS